MRKYILILLILVIVIGLLSSHYEVPYAGDILWAMMILLGLFFLFPNSSLNILSILSLGFCFFIETTQLFHNDWLERLRHTFLVYVLGHGTFSFVDLGCYVIGVVFSYIVVKILFKFTS